MPQNPAEFVRVSTAAGHFSVPAAVAAAGIESGEYRALKQDATDGVGVPLPPKWREDLPAPVKSAATEAATKLRSQKAAATPNPEPTATDAPADNPEEK